MSRAKRPERSETPRAVRQCNCSVKPIWEYVGKKVPNPEIIYCSLHATASELLESLAAMHINHHPENCNCIVGRRITAASEGSK